MRFDGRENLGATHENHVADQKGAHLAGAAPLLLAVKARHGSSHVGFEGAFAGETHRFLVKRKSAGQNMFAPYLVVLGEIPTNAMLVGELAVALRFGGATIYCMFRLID